MIDIKAKLVREVNGTEGNSSKDNENGLDKLKGESDVDAYVGIDKQSHLEWKTLNDKSKTTTFYKKSKRSPELLPSRDSPGLKALKSKNIKEVRKKVIDIENKKVKRILP